MTPLEGFLYIMKHAKITQSGYSSPVLTPQWGRWELQGRWFGWPLGTAKCRGSEVGRLAEPLVETRNAAKHSTMHRTDPHTTVIQPKMSIVQRLGNCSKSRLHGRN